MPFPALTRFERFDVRSPQNPYSSNDARIIRQLGIERRSERLAGHVRIKGWPLPFG